MTFILLKLDIHEVQETFEWLCTIPFESGTTDRPQGIQQLIEQVVFHLKDDDEKCW